jgi:hypothetical protein
VLVSLGLDQHIENLALSVDRPPQVDLPFAGPPLDIGEEERTLVVTSAQDPSQKGA